MDSSDEWIISRTGIKQRYFCADGESTSTLAVKAAQKAIDAAGVSKEDISLIVVGTCTADLFFPSVAMQVQDALDIPNGPAFDVNAACSGFVYGMHVINSMLAEGGIALLIGAERFSNLLDWEDRGTCFLFGDGAGAVVLQADAHFGKGCLGVRINGDGRGGKALYVTGGVGSTGTIGDIVMNGRDVFKQAVRTMGKWDDDWFVSCGVKREDVDLYIPHQANIRILKSAADAAKFDWDKVVVSLSYHANTSAASIPLALNMVEEEKRLKDGNLLYFQAFGAGFTWGEMLYRW